MAILAWTPAAQHDLAEIFEYIARERLSLSAAARVVLDLTEKADLYAAQPLLAASRPELGDDLRSFVLHRYMVVYRPFDGGIEVIRVLHGSRDVFAIFRRD